MGSTFMNGDLVKKYNLENLTNKSLKLSDSKISGLSRDEMKIPDFFRDVKWNKVKTYGDLIGLDIINPDTGQMEVCWLRLKNGGSLQLEFTCAPQVKYGLVFKCKNGEIKLHGPTLVTKNPAR